MGTSQKPPRRPPGSGTPTDPPEDPDLVSEMELDTTPGVEDPGDYVRGPGEIARRTLDTRKRLARRRRARPAGTRDQGR